MTTIEFSTASREQISVTEFQEALGRVAGAETIELFTGATTEVKAVFDSSM
jgi:hypothetical protein